MSSKKKEGSSSSKKKFPFFSSTRKSNPLATSPSTDNTVKIPALEAQHIENVIATVIRTYAKKSPQKKKGKSKTKLKTKTDPDVLDPDPAKPKSLAKLFKKYGDNEIPTIVRQHVPPKLSPAESQPIAIATVDPEVDPDKEEKAAIKIQTAFRRIKYRTLYRSTLKKVVKVQALVRGFLTRRHKANPPEMPTIPEEELASAVEEPEKVPEVETLSPINPEEEELASAEEEPEKLAETDEAETRPAEEDVDGIASN